MRNIKKIEKPNTIATTITAGSSAIEKKPPASAQESILTAIEIFSNPFFVLKLFIPTGREKYMSMVRKGIIQIKLPRSYPPMFHTWETYKDEKNKEIALLFRKKIEQTLIQLHESVKPIARQFELYYSLFTEGHPSIVGHAFTKKIKMLMSSPLDKEKEYLTTYHVYIKLRDPIRPNDPKLLLNKTTSMAITLHELAHLRCYDHSFSFALLLRDIFKAAMKLKLLPEGNEEQHMIPSRRSWERVLFEKRGNMSDEELKVVYDEFIQAQEGCGMQGNDDDSLLDMEEKEQHDGNKQEVSGQVKREKVLEKEEECKKDENNMEGQGNIAPIITKVMTNISKPSKSSQQHLIKLPIVKAPKYSTTTTSRPFSSSSSTTLRQPVGLSKQALPNAMKYPLTGVKLPTKPISLKKI